MKATHERQGRPFRYVKALWEPGYHHQVFSEDIEAAITTLLLEGGRTNIRHVDERVRDIKDSLLGGGFVEELYEGCSEYQQQASIIARKQYASFYE